MNRAPTLDDIESAASRIAGAVHRTPVLVNKTFNEFFSSQLYFKCENLQKVGAFKARGATNATFSLEESALSRGVATHSSGNHAAALSYAARLKGVPAYIVMPNNAPKVKVDAVRSYGGEISFCEPSLQARESGLEEIVNATGANVVHPYNDYRVIAGQATATLELLAEVASLDLILVPVGGGGLLSGTALATSFLSPSTSVIACEPEGADDARRSIISGELLPSVNPRTIADGLLTSLGDKTFPIIREHVHDIVTVSESSIVRATRLVMERMKCIIEPSAAVTLAAILEEKIDVKGKKAGLILSGGNIEMEKFLKQSRKIEADDSV